MRDDVRDLTSRPEPRLGARTYCCMTGVAGYAANKCIECSGMGPHRPVPAGLCGAFAECGVHDHGHPCEREPDHEGSHDCPLGRGTCAAGAADKVCFFVSGHLDITEEEFCRHYAGRIEMAAQSGASFVVGDARGTDLRAQRLLSGLGCARVTIYHMLEAPRHRVGGYPVVGGFKSDEDRDAAMTAASTCDIAWVRPGREGSGTARNLARRQRR